MLEITELILVCKEVLQITKPIDIRAVTVVKKKENGTAAWYWPHCKKGKPYRHVIWLNIPEILVNKAIEPTQYNLETIVAHELIHAAMGEHGSLNHEKHHCDKFQSAAAILEENLQKLGFNIGQIYCPITDDE